MSPLHRNGYSVVESLQMCQSHILLRCTPSPCPFTHVPGPDYRGCQLPHWLLAQKPLPSPSLVFPANSVVEEHRYLCLTSTLAHFEESYRALGQGC